MNPKIGVAALVVAVASIAFGGLYTTAHVARATGGESADTSCTSTSPCLLESNSSSGTGVKSTSTMGNGLIGQTSAVGKNSTTGRSAVLGQDEQTSSGDGLFNFGVTGTSKNGTGVAGTGGSTGVIGTATTANGIGVIGATTSEGGLDFEGSGQGIGNGLPVFTLNDFGQAVFGDAGAGYGDGSILVNQRCGNGTPMFEGDDSNVVAFRVDDCGNVDGFGDVGVGLNSTLFAGTIQAYNGNPVNVDAALAANDLFTSADPYGEGTNYTATDSAGVTWLYQGYSTTQGKYSIEMGDSGSIYARIFITTGSVRMAQPTTSGARVDTYAQQDAQPTIEDVGEAQLSGGVANVPLDPRFAAAIDATVKYFVTLTPEGDCRGLYVAQRNGSGFVVRELQGGRSSIAFTYRIDAKPLGATPSRLAPSALPYEFVHAVPAPTKMHIPTLVKAPHISARTH